MFQCYFTGFYRRITVGRSPSQRTGRRRDDHGSERPTGDDVGEPVDAEVDAARPDGGRESDADRPHHTSMRREPTGHEQREDAPDRCGLRRVTRREGVPAGADQPVGEVGARSSERELERVARAPRDGRHHREDDRRRPVADPPPPPDGERDAHEGEHPEAPERRDRSHRGVEPGGAVIEHELEDAFVRAGHCGHRRSGRVGRR